MPTSTLTTAVPVEQPTYTWVPAEGLTNLFYKVDPTTGEYIYTTEAPQEGDVYQTRTRTYETGEYKDDPTSKRTYYTVQGYDEPEGSKARITWSGLKKRNEAIRHIRTKDNYKEIYGLDSKPSRWDLLYDENVRTSLKEGEYAKPSYAYNVDHLLYPQKRQLTLLGKLYPSEYKVWGSTRTTHGECADCGDSGYSKAGKKSNLVTGLAWQAPKYVEYNARIKDNIKYTKQLPVTETVTEYAIAQPGSTQTQITATEQSGTQVPAVKRPVRRASATSTTSQTQRPVKKTATTAYPQTTAQSTATGTRYYYDPDGGLIRQVPMSQEEVLAVTSLRLGGRLNYLDYTK